jgi:hypothetical protein
LSYLQRSQLAAAVGCAVLLIGGQAFADPVVGSGSSESVTATVPTPSLSPDGDPISRPVDANSLLPTQPATPSAVQIESRFKAAHAARVRADNRRLRKLIRSYKNSAAGWARIMGLPVKLENVRHLAGMSYLRRQKLIWKRTDNSYRIRAQHPPHLGALMCIHHYEGSWTDTSAPFWGGLQMNYDFQATYGGWLLRTKGTADHWTPLEQIWTAEKAVRSRGFYPWPNTARYCGLI